MSQQLFKPGANNLAKVSILAGGLITAVWAAGTARGLWLVRKGERGELTCALPAR